MLSISNVYNYWNFFKRLPMGKLIFSRLVSVINPYTGSIKAQVCELRPGYSKIILKDRRSIRNHLNSIHAIALTNLGEYSSGLALITQFNEKMRGIPTEININFLKKARGELTAISDVKLPAISEEIDFQVTSVITDSHHDTVATVNVNWRIGLKHTENEK